MKGVAADREEHVTLLNLVILGQMVRALLWKSAEKFDTSSPAFQTHSRSSEPTWVDRTPETSYSNYGPISYQFRDKWRLQVKNCRLFPPARVFNTPAEWVPLKLGETGGP